MHIVWLCLMLLLDFAISETFNLTAQGRTFLLAFSKPADPEISILAYTMEDSEFQVKLSLTVPGSQEHIYLGKMTVSQLEVSEYILTGANIPTSSSDYDYHNCLLMTAESTFGVQVQMYTSKISVAGFMALPVHLWGNNYVIVTLQENPFFIVVSATKTKFTISLVSTPVVEVTFNGSSRAIGGNNRITISIDSFQAFSMTKCGETDYKVSFTGSRIESYHPVGVISGSCNAYNMKNQNCTEVTELSNADHAAEMMFPEKLLGREFLVAFDYSRENFSDYIIIVSAFMETNVTTYCPPVQKHFLGAVGSVLEIPSHMDPTTRHRHMFIKSNKPISVVQALVSACDQYAFGGPSLITIVPNELFYDAYVLVFPVRHNIAHHHLVMVAPTSADIANIVVNGTKNLRQRSKAIHMDHYTPGASQVVGHSILFTDKLAKMHIKGRVKFGCYYVGVLGNSSYYISAGFLYQEEIQPKCTKLAGFSGDRIDNDCDGLIDEEFSNEIDDDGDGAVDEDTFNTSSCKMKGRWGKDCLLACSEYCLGDCDKDSGVCPGCVPGRQEPLYFCFRECPAFTFGYNCSGNCNEKCKQRDCLERVNGECPPEIHVTMPESTSYFWYWVLLILLCAMVGLFLVYYKSESPMEETKLEAVVEIDADETTDDTTDEKENVMMDEYSLWLKRKRSGSNTDEPDQYNLEYILKTSIFKDGKYFPKPSSRSWTTFFLRPKPEPVKKSAVQALSDALDNLNAQTIAQSMENVSADQVVSALDNVGKSLLGSGARRTSVAAPPAPPSNQKPAPVPTTDSSESSIEK